jgi:hypothetical protein
VLKEAKTNPAYDAVRSLCRPWPAVAKSEL